MAQRGKGYWPCNAPHHRGFSVCFARSPLRQNNSHVWCKWNVVELKFGCPNCWAICARCPQLLKSKRNNVRVTMNVWSEPSLSLSLCVTNYPRQNIACSARLHWARVAHSFEYLLFFPSLFVFFFTLSRISIKICLINKQIFLIVCPWFHLIGECVI